jgi:predicted nucleic acid-binding protein
VSEAFLLDTSAVLTYFDDEEGADRVGHLLAMAGHRRIDLYASFVSLIELRYILMQEKDEASADYAVGLFKSWPLELAYPNEVQSLLAARFKATHRVSLADAIIAAQAFHLHACLVHKDPEFDSLAGEVKLESLPYKRKS